MALLFYAALAAVLMVSAWRRTSKALGRASATIHVLSLVVWASLIWPLVDDWGDTLAMFPFLIAYMLWDDYNSRTRAIEKKREALGIKNGTQ